MTIQMKMATTPGTTTPSAPSAPSSGNARLRGIAEALGCSRLPPPLPSIETAAATAPPLRVEPRWRPDPCPLSWCKHGAMAAVYRERLGCSWCGRESPFGWLHHSVTDKDPLILEAKVKGDTIVADDVIGTRFVDFMFRGGLIPIDRTRKTVSSMRCWRSSCCHTCR
ncbi:hypothetical protein N657DRAFT_439481 [Parathielavia appendiculata]|uniref:Uncharacterized protein n=1 Tax=Parathielavia appendiculata TaxID=2587402 RepID=A0AAN6U141_9PEZI|nr:hypothetical protein N657DRAFT_439481 [Parathielavia appendiculata]